MDATISVHFGGKFMGDTPPTFAGESAYAEPLTKTTACLVNTPFFAFGFAHGDVVKHKDGEVISMSKDSGNRVARFMVNKKKGWPLEWVSDIVRGEFGLGHDDTAAEGGFTGLLLAVSYPGEKRDKAVALFDRLVKQGVVTSWEDGK